ncbi:hypothetical protein [Saccharospirillum salsuginis]|uniref:Uncharacterized protein n=1 Tax=Saccharospirillum salsuginis TaxID=418750 RepID=A0A918K851_9GAMM|nr:hypothetical protein [Saccharospirillum salsuginis]GGX50892.1 hypothetical protein GCM10007392_17620 [Saccharospirillum salsuginis]
MESTVGTVQSLIQSNSTVVILGTLVLLLAANLWHHARKIRRLEQKLVSQHRYFRQEMKMMNQGAIGVGHRVKHLEKRMRKQVDTTPAPAPARKQPSAFEQLLNGYGPAPEEAPISSPRTKTPDIRSNDQNQPSRAEQALADWMKDYRTTA